MGNVTVLSWLCLLINLVFLSEAHGWNRIAWSGIYSHRSVTSCSKSGMSQAELVRDDRVHVDNHDGIHLHHLPKSFLGQLFEQLAHGPGRLWLQISCNSCISLGVVVARITKNYTWN